MILLVHLLLKSFARMPPPPFIRPYVPSYVYICYFVQPSCMLLVCLAVTRGFDELPLASSVSFIASLFILIGCYPSLGGRYSHFLLCMLYGQQTQNKCLFIFFVNKGADIAFKNFASFINQNHFLILSIILLSFCSQYNNKGVVGVDSDLRSIRHNKHYTHKKEPTIQSLRIAWTTFATLNCRKSVYV